MATILQVSFRYELAPDRFAEENGPEVAARVAQLPGLLWKLWLHDADRRECVGVYRWVTRELAEQYANGPIVAHLRAAEGYTDVRTQLFEVLEEQSRITSAPGLDEAVPA